MDFFSIKFFLAKIKKLLSKHNVSLSVFNIILIEIIHNYFLCEICLIFLLGPSNQICLNLFLAMTYTRFLNFINSFNLHFYLIYIFFFTFYKIYIFTNYYFFLFCSPNIPKANLVGQNC